MNLELKTLVRRWNFHNIGFGLLGFDFRNSDLLWLVLAVLCLARLSCWYSLVAFGWQILHQGDFVSHFHLILELDFDWYNSYYSNSNFLYLKPDFQLLEFVVHLLAMERHLISPLRDIKIALSNHCQLDVLGCSLGFKYFSCWWLACSLELLCRCFGPQIQYFQFL